MARSGVDGLSVERLTLLGRVHVARVSVHSLHLHSLDLSTSGVGKLSHKMTKRSGRPPRPLRNQKPWLVHFVLHAVLGGDSFILCDLYLILFCCQ